MILRARKVLFGFVCMLLFVGGIEAQEVGPSRNNLEKDHIEALQGDLKKVSLADGISAAEAVILTRVYSALYVGCGSLVGVTDGGDHWKVHGFVGLGGEEVKGFKIMKTTGEIISTVGPSFKDYSKLME